MINLNKYPAITLNDRQICDLELLTNQSFYPLSGYLNKTNYELVLNEMRLQSGALWPIPIVLDVSKTTKEKIKIRDAVILKDKEGFQIALLKIEEIWKPDMEKESNLLYGTTDTNHYGVYNLKNSIKEYYVAGEVELISSPRHFNYTSFRHSPEELKKIFNNEGWKKIIAFQTRNPIHKAHYEMTKEAMETYNANLLIHPVIGVTKSGDIDYHTRVRCYKHILKRYKQGSVKLSLLPLAMRMAGPKEALWHAIIRKNFGCTHIIIGRDHAGPGNNKEGKPYYKPYDSQALLKKYQNEIGIEMVPFNHMVYVPIKRKYISFDKINKNTKFKTISGSQLRDYLNNGDEIPEWFSFQEISSELQKSIPPLKRRGFTVFFTGLSGSGKSTLANGLMAKFLEAGDRQVTLLDGDLVRTNLSSELGFSKKDRSINVRRIGYVASEITKNRGIAICAPIAPYEKDRQFNKNLISSFGGYIEIFVNTPLKECEKRDAKGLYKLAREGTIKEFTGISDPYEKPIRPDLILNSSHIEPSKLVEEIFLLVKNLGYI